MSLTSLAAACNTLFGPVHLRDVSPPALRLLPWGAASETSYCRGRGSGSGAGSGSGSGSGSGCSSIHSLASAYSQPP